MRQPEKVEQEKAKQLLRALGAKFYVAGTRRRRGDYQGTMQTPGLADLPLVFLPAFKRRLAVDPAPAMYELVVVEMKSAKGRLSTEQKELQHYCTLANVPYICGTFATLVQWLIDHHYLAPEQVAHYYTDERRPRV